MKDLPNPEAIEMKDLLTPYSKQLKWLVLLLPILLYSNTINHGFALDDYSVIVTHSHVQNGIDGVDEILSTNYRNGNSGFNDGLYRPLSLVTFAVEKEFFNSNPSISHGINILLYAFACFFLFISLRRIFENFPIIIPLGIILLFIIHPLHTEVVANIKGRDDLLAFLGFSSCLLLLLKYLQQQKLKHLIFGLICYTVALFSKESAVTFSVFIPLLLLLKTELNIKKLILLTICLGGLAVSYFILRTSIINSMPNPVDPGNFGLLNNPIAATENSSLRWGATFALQLLFLLKLFFPFELLHDYSYNQLPLVRITSWQSIIGLCILTALTTFAVWGVIKKNRFGIITALYLISIAIGSQLFITIGIQFAERMLFMAVLPLALFISLGLHYLLKKKNNLLQVKQQKSMALVSLILLILFSIKTFNRNKVWADNLSLYQADIEKGAKSARVNYNLGSELNEQVTSINDPTQKTAYLNQSIKYLSTAIQIYPDYYDAYNNLGLAYKASGQLEKSIQVHLKNLQLNPNYTKGYYNLATTYADNKQYQEAISTMQHYVDRNPSNATAYFLMGEAAGNKQDFEAAALYLNQALKLKPNNPDYLNFLGMAYGMLGKNQKAQQSFERILQQQPNRTDVLMNLALSFHNQNKVNAERKVIERILQLEPSNKRAKVLMENL